MQAQAQTGTNASTTASNRDDLRENEIMAQTQAQANNQNLLPF